MRTSKISDSSTVSRSLPMEPDKPESQSAHSRMECAQRKCAFTTLLYFRVLWSLIFLIRMDVACKPPLATHSVVSPPIRRARLQRAGEAEGVFFLLLLSSS